MAITVLLSTFPTDGAN